MATDSADDERDEHGRAVDARAARGVQVGDHNTQVIYSYHGTWTDGVAPAPLVGVGGEVESPYRGLGWFSERDAPFFFGRDTVIDEVLQRLSLRVEQPDILMVSGVSGAGKSSLVHAGVLPRVRGQGLLAAPSAHSWPRLVLTPGHAPLDELALSFARVSGSDAAAVRRELRADPTGFAVQAAQAAHTVPASNNGPRGLLLVVDQFEQIFTQCEDEVQRRAFITALHAAATAGNADAVVLVVLVVRADFGDRCADYEPLTEAVQHRYLVTAMTERQLRMAITEPAKQAGARVDDDLAQQLLRETHSRTEDSSITSAAGVLPLLSYAMDRTWRLRAGDTLTVADYDRSGGLEKAVAESAQRAYESLDDRRRHLARRIFTRLVISGADGVETADRVHRDTLVWEGIDVADVDAVLAAFTDERLLTVGAKTVEISHEVLLSKWPLLRDTWLAETQENRAVCARVRVAAAEWERGGRDPAHLYSGSVLDNAVTTAAAVAADPARYPPLGVTETEFLAAGTRASRRRTVQRRAALGVLIFLVVALAAAALVAVRIGVDLADQRNQAVASELVSSRDRLASSDPFGSRVSALAAGRIDPSAKTRHGMLTAVGNPAVARIAHDGLLTSTALSADGNTLVTGDLDGPVELRDMASNQPLGEPFIARNGPAWSLALSADGSTLAIGGDGTVELWDVPEHRLLAEPFGDHDGPVWSVALSKDGKTLATGDDGSVRLWDAESHERLGELLAGNTDGTNGMAFSPDGTTFAAGASDGTIHLWDVEHRTPADTPLVGSDKSVRSVAFGPDGKTLVSSGRDNEARLWDVKGRKLLRDPLKAGRPVDSVAFSPDGKTVAIATSAGVDQVDSEIVLFDVENNRQLGRPLTGHSGAVDTMTFGPDSNSLVSGSEDNSVRVWDVSGRRPGSEQIIAKDAKASETALSRDSRTLAVGAGEGALRLWDVEHNRPRGELITAYRDLSPRPLVFSPDGRTLAVGTEEGVLRLWDVRNNRPRGAPTTAYRTLSPQPVVFSPDGNTVAIGTADDTVQLWDVEHDQPRGDPITARNGTVMSIAFHPNGNVLAIGGDSTVQLWDLEAHGALGKPLPIHNSGSVFSMEFSPDGKTLATGTLNSTVQLWDVENQRSRGEPLNSNENFSVGVMAFSHDGETLATSTTDRTVQLWDVEGNGPIGEPLTSPGGRVGAVAFGPEDDTLVDATRVSEVSLWDVGFTGNPAQSLCAVTPNWFTEDKWNEYVPAELAYRKLC
ncbi:nSTAND1 domain-containing NTPase [Nocardia callitridis]|uniref:Novel STAND NTPase 1 domain-containing protein n=1 Tax=Nocardia callitridis TaxID=648753 RepID=A0ABP9K1R0_9NOCA